jgi:hypothetical protein|tara:strand:+ start:96 stop:341 length:246 start_codon:yes stop_codon:yes gene_type:complete
LELIENKYTIHYDDLWVSFIPKTDKARSWIQDYKGKGHEWYRFMAKCVDYEGGITFPYNRVNKFRTYLKVKLRKDHGFKER